MCIAIAKPKGTFISEKTLHNCWVANPDGAGFAFVNPEFNVEVHKFMTFKAFYEAYAVADQLYGDASDFLIHFRITSRGATRIDNCHPFQINDKMAFIHNGTITSMPIDKEHQHSDTYMFNELILKKLPENWELNEGIQYLIEEMIGWSKIVVLHAETGLTIYNENKGVHDCGIWYSNVGYKDRVVYRGEDYWKKQHGNDHHWDYHNESLDDWRDRLTAAKEKKEKEDAEAAQKLIEHNADTTGDAETEELLLVQCCDCFEWVDEETVYPIEGIYDTVKCICEDCLIIRDQSQIEYTIVNLSDDEFEELLADYGCCQ